MPSVSRLPLLLLLGLGSLAPCVLAQQPASPPAPPAQPQPAPAAQPAPQQRPTSVDDEATAQQAQTASNEPSQPVQPPVVVRAPRPDVPVPPRQVETGREDDLDVPDFLK